MVSPAGQAAIAAYKIDGEQLFFPNAKACASVRGTLPRHRRARVRPALAQDVVKVHAAGSLKAALTDAAAAFADRKDGALVDFAFGPSGLLKERLEKGEASDLFASANMAHPKALADAGKAGPVRAFARNSLCVLAGPP